MHLEIFVYLLCRFPGENRIYAVQRKNSFTSGALPRNWPSGLVIEDRSCKNWHSDSFPRADSGCQPCGNNFTTRTNSKSTPAVAKHPDCTHNPGGKTAAPVRSAAWGAIRPGGSRESASSGLLLWQAERNHLPIFFRRYPLRSLFSEAARYKEFNDLRHTSPHTCRNKAAAKKFSF